VHLMDGYTYQANATPKSLSRRGSRGAAVVAYNTACLPARLLLDAREEHRLAHARAKDALSSPETPPADALALVRASIALRAQLMDLLGTPTRPRGETPRRRPIEAGIPTEALEIPPEAPNLPPTESPTS
jgi:hypothetical protein